MKHNNINIKVNEKFNYPKIIIYLLLLIAGVWFYWTQLRVTWIRKQCYKEADNIPKYQIVHQGGDFGDSYIEKDMGEIYRKCLIRKGLPSIF